MYGLTIQVGGCLGRMSVSYQSATQLSRLCQELVLSHPPQRLSVRYEAILQLYPYDRSARQEEEPPPRILHAQEAITTTRFFSTLGVRVVECVNPPIHNNTVCVWGFLVPRFSYLVADCVKKGTKAHKKSCPKLAIAIQSNIFSEDDPMSTMDVALLTKHSLYMVRATNFRRGGWEQSQLRLSARQISRSTGITARGMENVVIQECCQSSRFGLR